MIKYLRYPSLVNHYAIGKEYRITEKLDEMWYATEKIHGANTAYYLDREGNEKFAKRSGFIDFEIGDKQFNELPKCITTSIKNSAQTILKENPLSQYIIVYGEFFGSGIQIMEYDVVKDKAKKFLVFDTFIKSKCTETSEYYVLGRNELELYFRSEDLVPLKETATLRQLLKGDVDEDSLLGGYSEGDVFKPLKGYLVEEGNRYTGVKYKTKKYLETERVSTKQPKSKPNWSLEDLEVREDLGRYITKNRVNNVVSHGEFELIPQNIGNIMTAVKMDAIKEYKRETDKDIKEETNFEMLINGYSGIVANFIKEAIQENTFKVIA